MKNRDIFIITLVILFILAFPFVLAIRFAGKDAVFIGFLLNPMDGSSYLAKMFEGWAGSWQFTLPYTAPVGHGAFLFLFYIFLGHLARWGNLPLLFVFHLARLVCSFFFLYTLFRFYQRLFPVRTDMLRNAYLLTAMGAGMGWLLVFFGKIPFDFWVAEAYPFLSMYSNPHFPAGMGLLLLAIIQLLEMPSLRRNLSLLLCGLFIAIIFPFGLVLILALACGGIIWQWFAEKRFDWSGILCIGLLGGPFLLYQFFVTLQDPLLSGWNLQNLTLTPNLGDVVLSLSPVLLFAIPGSIWLLRQKEFRGKAYLFLWPIIGLLLAYLPVSLQRRFTFGLYIPLVVLAVYGIDAMRSRFPGWSKRALALTIALSLPTNFLLVASALLAAQHQTPLLYLTQDEAQAVAWIGENVPQDAVILASPQLSLVIPAWNGRRVVYAHPFETVNAVVQEQDVLGFFKEPAWTKTKVYFLAKNKIRYLVLGPREQALGEKQDVSSLILLKQFGHVAIYSVPADP
jgi:hypothetical protein